MRFYLLSFIFSLLAELQKLLTVLNCAFKLTLSLIDHTDLLVALCFDVLILGLLCDLQALLKELKRHVKVVVLQVLIGNQLVHSHQVC